MAEEKSVGGIVAFLIIVGAVIVGMWAYAVIDANVSAIKG